MTEVTDLPFKKIQIALRKMSPQDGDIFTIQLPPETGAEEAQLFTAGLHNVLPEGVSVLVLREDTKADIISEETLNQLGYFRNVQ